MNESLRSILLLFAAMHLAGCAGWLKPYHMDGPSLSEKWQARALEWEKSNEIQRALLDWKIVGELNPEDGQAAKKITNLKTVSEKRAERHFKLAKAFYNKGAFERARKEFTITLRYDPNDQKALDYLKNTMAWEGYTSYRVKPDDTIMDIARSVYKDTKKDFLVAYFLDLETQAKPARNTVIRFPVLESEFTEQLMDVIERLSKARKLFKGKNYEKVLGITDQILAYEPENKEAAELRNASYYQLGKKFRGKRMYLEALNMFSKVAPGYEDIEESMAGVQRSILQQSEMHYKKGVKHFVNEDLEGAIAEWEKTLALNPGHQKAKDNIENAKSLLEKWNQIK